MNPQPRPAGHRRTTSALAVAGIASLVVATAGTLLATSPADAGTPPTQPTAPSFDVGSNPIDMAVATYAHRAYVAQDGSLATVDTQTHQMIDNIATGVPHATAIAMVQSGAKYYVAGFDSGKLAIFDPTTDSITGTVRVGSGTTDIAEVVTTRGDFAYLTQYGQHFSRVTVVNAKNDQVVDRFHLGGKPGSAQQAPGLGALWVGTEQGENVKVVNPRTHRVERTIALPKSGPVGGIAFNPSGSTGYVTGLGGLTAIKASTGSTRWFMGATRLFPHAPNINVGPVVAGPHRTLSVVNSTFPDSAAQGSVTTIMRPTRKVVSRTLLGTEPTSLAADPMGKQLLATNYAVDTVSWLKQPR
jgi:DNA-binding beta-propeller fold protein YncE